MQSLRLSGHAPTEKAWYALQGAALSQQGRELIAAAAILQTTELRAFSIYSSVICHRQR